jgi:prolyl 4-hydroxylase
MGTLLEIKDEPPFGIPQMVRYHQGEKFDIHRDWYGRPERYNGGWFDRVASFFVYLDGDGIVGGETWFPLIDVGEKKNGKGNGNGKWMRRTAGGDGEDGGTMFVPKKGNALFWVNLFANGTGDKRVEHAGLPLLDGRKTAMNLWPKKVYEMGWWDEYSHLVHSHR